MAAPKTALHHPAIQQAAKALFWKHGIRRVSVEEISKEAGVSKMTFYRHYANKHELAERILRDALSDGRRKYRAIMRSDAPFPERIRKVVQLEHETSEGMSTEFMKDVFRDPAGPLAKIMEAENKAISKDLAADIRLAQREGFVRADVKPDFVLYLMEQFQVFIQDDRFMAMYKNPQDAYMALANFVFYGLFPPEGRTGK
jgi:AcrR family transcriptional regulator